MAISGLKIIIRSHLFTRSEFAEFEKDFPNQNEGFSCITRISGKLSKKQVKKQYPNWKRLSNKQKRLSQKQY